MALDLRKCGFGNVLLMCAGMLRDSKDTPPELYHDNPDDELKILDRSFFRMTDDPSTIDPRLNARYCNLSTLADPRIAEIVRKIARVPESIVVDKDVDAGFCFRVRIPALDGDVELMTGAAIEAMIRIMTRYRKPLACGNDRAVLERVRERVPWSVIVPCSSWGVRNAEDHIAQWYALSRCPIVFHGIGGNGCVTSTFAPVAAIFGNAGLVGIDPLGNACYGQRYHW
jgi:hypothetical protein